MLPVIDTLLGSQFKFTRFNPLQPTQNKGDDPALDDPAMDDPAMDDPAVDDPWGKCSFCKRVGTSTAPIKICSNCKAGWYCSRDCQKGGWSSHKAECAETAHIMGPNGGAARTALANKLDEMHTNLPSRPGVLELAVSDPFVRLREGRWPDDCPKTDIYKLLIDTYRVLMSDTHTHTGFVSKDGLTSVNGFKRFLARMHIEWQLLPSWWTPNNVAECCVLGTETTNWMLNEPIELDGIDARYGETLMVTQLRMFGGYLPLAGARSI